MTLFVYNPPQDMPSFWDFSDRELLRSCRIFIEQCAPADDEPAHQEAKRLLRMWSEIAENLPGLASVREEQAAYLAGLRKRTIQMLIRISLKERPLIPLR